MLNKYYKGVSIDNHFLFPDVLMFPVSHMWPFLCPKVIVFLQKFSINITAIYICNNKGEYTENLGIIW